MKEKELKPGYEQMDKPLVLSDVVKCVQYNQYPIGHYGLEVKVPEDRYGTLMYKIYRVVKERSMK